MIRTAALLLLISASLAAWGQKVYRWVDEDGNVHYGDRVPPQYAEQVFGRPQTETSETPEEASAERAKLRRS